MKRQKGKTLKEEFPRSVGAQYATGDQWRNNFRKNERMEPKQKHHPVVDTTDDRSKVLCCKEQYCIGSWNVSSMNQGKLEVVKQEMASVNVNIHSCHLLFDHFQFALIHKPNISDSFAILLFTESDLASVTSHIHHCVLLLLWLCLFILSGVIAPLISSSVLGTYWPGEFLLLFMGLSRQEYWSGLPFLLQWTTFCQTSPPWPTHLGLPHGHGLVSLR